MFWNHENDLFNWKLLLGAEKIFIIDAYCWIIIISKKYEAISLGGQKPRRGTHAHLEHFYHDPGTRSGLMICVRQRENDEKRSSC